jgi:DNA-binding NarL/FixJ family response regulator
MKRIVIFEDDHDLRQSLKILLNGTEGYVVVGDYGDCMKAEAIITSVKPDLVIMDIDLPGKSGIEGVRMIKEVSPLTPVIVHTVFEDDEKLFDSLCSGANGYILKNTTYLKLLNALEEVLKGGAPMSPSIAVKVVNSFHHIGANKYHLSSREKEILSWLVKGHSYKMIAAECFISIETVRVHIKNIYNKLHVNCGKQAVAIALKDQIL